MLLRMGSEDSECSEVAVPNGSSTKCLQTPHKDSLYRETLCRILNLKIFFSCMLAKFKRSL